MSHFAAGNPMANAERKQPLEEITAEGFGSATTVPDSPSSSHGVWKDGVWTIVIDRPVTADDPLVGRLKTASQNLIAFSVWDGSNANRGGRKQHSAWVPLKVEK
jgi:complex iron-sulfur molybdoenzyme family reductase subunit gamma